jgi:3-oxoacyl-[acyl-carrier-protein] synthase-3
MPHPIYSCIVGTGSAIPARRVKGSDFYGHGFYDEAGEKLERPAEETVAKFQTITGIEERRYVDDDTVASDLAYAAALDALESSGVDRESLDFLVVAHNFGDVAASNRRSDFVPTLAARVKHRLEIDNPKTIAYDLPFGCPGWLQAMIQGNYYIRSGDAKRGLVIGAETLSRVSDPHDRDGMIYADGAGATILEARESETPVGILAHASRSDTRHHAYMLWMGPSNKPSGNGGGGDLLLKMNGRKLYEYALKTVPPLVKDCLAKAGVTLDQVDKILIHQANEKMDEAIAQRLYRICGVKKIPADVMPMTISWLGNSSVATLPTLLDLILKGEMKAHHLGAGDTVIFASVGAGMNINAFVYRFC